MGLAEPGLELFDDGPFDAAFGDLFHADAQAEALDDRVLAVAGGLPQVAWKSDVAPSVVPPRSQLSRRRHQPRGNIRFPHGMRSDAFDFAAILRGL